MVEKGAKETSSYRKSNSVWANVQGGHKLVSPSRKQPLKGLLLPPGLQHIAQYRIVDMITACTHPDVKNTILERYKEPNTTL